jgi:hypothetical protein
MTLEEALATASGSKMQKCAGDDITGAGPKPRRSGPNSEM